MYNPYTFNIQESLKHAWHWGIVFRCLAAKVLKENTLFDLWPWSQGQGVNATRDVAHAVPSTSSDLCTSKVWCCYIPRLRIKCIYKKIHYLTLILVIRKVAQYPLHHVTYALQSLKLLSQMFKRRYIFKNIHNLTFDLGVNVTRNVAKYPLHHVTYAATKFDVATSNGLEGDTFTRNVIYRRTHGRT